MDLSIDSERIMTVSQLTGLISTLIEESFSYVRVEGEISNLRTPSSGHSYFTLKDEESQIRAVLFRGQKESLVFDLRDGLKVVCFGRLSVYRQRGEYQVIADFLEPSGLGSLHLAFEQLKEKLAKDGLFDEAIKRPLPPYPERIGVVTSPTGAAVRDILNVLARRNAGVDVIISPASVQGQSAAGEIVEALDILNRMGNVDAIILGRGGGSLEDLWPFNEESVARAIRASAIPVISAVGHERDFCISDFAADMRAPTPSAAAEIIARSGRELSKDIMTFNGRLESSMRSSLALVKGELAYLKESLKDPGRKLGEIRMRIDELSIRAERCLADKLKLLRSNLNGSAGRLDSLSPLSVLSRGYAIATVQPRGHIIRNKDDVDVGDLVDIRLERGILGCRVENKRM